MRILLTYEWNEMGGLEIVIVNMTRELIALGHTVKFFGPGPEDGWLSSALRKCGAEVRTYRYRGALDISLFQQLKDEIRSWKPDVVHSHDYWMSIYGAAAARSLGVRHVMAMHGNTRYREARYRRTAMRWAMKHSAAVIAISQDTRRELIQSLGSIAERVVVVPNGVPIRSGNAARGARSAGLAESEQLILAVGNTWHRKGFDVLIAACSLLPSTLAWRLVIAGRHEESASQLQMQIAELALSNRVSLVGARDDVPDLLAAATVFALPSRWEGLPLVILEAMHAGVGVVASAICGVPEAIRDRIDGLLVPADDPGALASALERLLSDERLRQKLAASARERAAKHFSASAMTEHYLRIYAGSTLG